MTRLAALTLGVLGSLAIPACDLDVPDLNNPGLDQLETHPDAVSVGAACTGLLIGNRSNIAAENGYVVQLGILGREAYNFDAADPRYIGELLQGTLNQGSPFGGAFWGAPYANIRLANVILHALDKVPSGELDENAKAAIRGFVHTMQALDLLQVIVTHDANGAVIDTDHDITQLGAIVGRDAAYAEIARLLDGAVTDLAAGGDSFPFLLSAGYAGFDTPKTFLQFNRAIRARVGAYVASSAAAADKPAAYQKVLDFLKDSFLDDNSDTGAGPDFNLGVYYTFSTKSGDTTSALINPNIYAHPALATDVQKNNTTADLRFTRKVATAKKAGAGGGLASTLQFTPLYASPESRVALIRNEELILLKAEALFYTVNATAALDELNLVRQSSGGLPALVGVPNESTFLDELLYERRYSLMFEGGHRWIDLRRFGRPLPLDKSDDVRNVRYPIPLAECNARPNEPKCDQGSTDS